MTTEHAGRKVGPRNAWQWLHEHFRLSGNRLAARKASDQSLARIPSAKPVSTLRNACLPVGAGAGDKRATGSIDGEWIDVTDEAVITEPNLVGRAMVWPLRGYLGTTVRCFMPGSMAQVLRIFLVALQ